MKKNEYFGFNEDMDIDPTDVYSDAHNLMEEIENAEKLAEARSKAVGIIVGKITKYFKYLGYGNTNQCAAAGNVWKCVCIEKAAKQAMRSLRIADVPADIIRDAAFIMGYNNDDAICTAISERIQALAEEIIANDKDDTK